MKIIDTFCDNGALYVDVAVSEKERITVKKHLGQDRPAYVMACENGLGVYGDDGPECGIRGLTGDEAAAVLALKKCIDWVCGQASGKILYPGRMSNEFSLPLDRIYEILNACENAGIAKSVLQSWCPSCNEYIGPIYSSIADVPSAFICPRCGTGISGALSKALVLYQMEEHD